MTTARGTFGVSGATAGAPADAVVDRDVVVVGCGAAGMAVTLGAAPRSVALLTKARFGEGGSSPMAQGGIAAAVGEGDSPHLHAADTLAVGGGLGEAEAVEILTAEGPERIRRLLELGMGFDRGAGGELALGREAAHSRRRILHARGDATGAELVRTLAAAVRGAPEVDIYEETFAVDLVVVEGRVVGVMAVDGEGRRVLYLARAVVLATGGLGRLYSHTTNPPEVTGDGLALAGRAGARLVDLEMVQFHPTALATGADPMPLLTEALRGEGAVLLDAAGHRFMVAEHPAAELAPRDVVARALHQRLAAGVRVFLDARRAVGEAFPRRFPSVFALCREHGLDPRREPIPVAPAAHYHMGGIDVDLWGRASLPGLWACGETASTGAHGANRLASNSLLEALVFGGRVAADVRRNLPSPVAAARALAAVPAALPLPEAGAWGGGRRWPVDGEGVVAAVRRLMWERVGLVREARGLAAALSRLEELAAAHPGLAGEARNLLFAARLVTAAACERRESRGGHYRADFPAPDPAWARRLRATVTAGGGVNFEPAGEPAPLAVPVAAGGRG